MVEPVSLRQAAETFCRSEGQHVPDLAALDCILIEDVGRRFRQGSGKVDRLGITHDVAILVASKTGPLRPHSTVQRALDPFPAVAAPGGAQRPSRERGDRY